MDRQCLKEGELKSLRDQAGRQWGRIEALEASNKTHDVILTGGNGNTVASVIGRLEKMSGTLEVHDDWIKEQKTINSTLLKIRGEERAEGVRRNRQLMAVVAIFALVLTGLSIFMSVRSERRAITQTIQVQP